MPAGRALRRGAGVLLATGAAGVLLYRAVALWNPAAGGAVAFAAMRRDAPLRSGPEESR